MFKSSPRTGIVLAMMAGGFVTGMVLAWTDIRFANLISPLAAAVTVTLALLGGCAAAVPLWNRIDEVVREAHKSAWYWGGSAGMCIAVGVMAYALRDSAGVIASWAPGLTASSGIALGVALCVALQTAGYALGWAVWWLSKR